MLEQAAAARPAGYLDAVLAAGTVRGEGRERIVLLTEDAYVDLARRFSTRTDEQLRTIVGGGAAARTGGPGTELKALLKDWLGIEASPGCSCNATAAKMNTLGPEWCESEAGMAEILGVMRIEHGKRWGAGKTFLPWSDTAAKALIRLACHRARAKSNA